MTVIAFILGLLIPACNGWLVLRALEGNTRVLFRVERWIMGVVTGLILTMLLSFVAHVTLGMPLHLWGFLAVQLITSAVTGALYLWKGKNATPAPIAPASPPLPKTLHFVFIILGIWIAIKVIVASVTFLLLTPTYLDDTLDNWNLRGKVYYVDQALTLVMPAEDPVLSPKGVSSYPPPVPMAKAWMATIAGKWSDALANSIHVVWYIAAVSLVYFALRRKVTLGWALTGTYLLSSIPLYLMHGTNPYADAFVSVHVFLAVSMVFSAVTETEEARRMAFFRIGALQAALLTFTKNEGLLVYLPPLLLILVVTLVLWKKTNRIPMQSAMKILAWYGGMLAALGLPWLIFKWSNGLTFGNAKPFTSLGFRWQENVLFSITVNTFFEANWIFLFPLLFALLIWRWRTAFTQTAVLSCFFLIVYIGQAMLFLFTALSHEALRQTGYARGLVHLTPVVVLLVGLLLPGAMRGVIDAYKGLATKEKMNVG